MKKPSRIVNRLSQGGETASKIGLAAVGEATVGEEGFSMLILGLAVGLVLVIWLGAVTYAKVNKEKLAREERERAEAEAYPAKPKRVAGSDD
jgi:hypothetical protein